ncbi:fimbrial biogenesis chaperone [Phytobacter ursingii]
MKRLFLMYCLVVLLLPLTALAGIQFNGTRVIYPADKREVTLGLTNRDVAPRLIQAWVDKGDNQVNPQQGMSAFIVIPPVFRLDGGKGQALRIMYTGQPLPQDRESVFWLNVLEVPPKQKGNQTNAIKISFHSRLKIFYRPKKLPGSPETAVNLLRWRLVSQGEDYAITCENPGAFNVSFSHISLKGLTNKKNHTQMGMCPAKGKKSFPFFGFPDMKKASLILKIIDDQGGIRTYETPLSQ